MANEKPKAETKKHEDKTIGGRVVRFYADGRKPEYQDTGEVYDEAIYQLLSAGDEQVEVQAPDLVKDILFWSPSYEDAEGKTHEDNAIRGCILATFRVPEQFLSAGLEDEDDDESDKEKVRYAFWVMLRAPTMVKNRDKKYVQAKAGDIVWVDVRTWNTVLLSAAAPRPIDPECGLPSGMVEFMMVPKGKRKFMKQITTGKDAGKQKPRFVWNVKLHGGWAQAMRDKIENKKPPYAFKAFSLDEMKLLGSRLLPPSVETMEQALASAGLLGSGQGPIDLGEAPHALVGASVPRALPAQGSETGLQN